MEGRSQFGNNRDGEGPEQTIIAMVTDEKGTPVMFRMLPGSIADIGIMMSTIGDMKTLGCHGKMIMDSGSESAKNVSTLLDPDVDFTVPSSVKSEPVKKPMTKVKDWNIRPRSHITTERHTGKSNTSWE